MKSRALNSRREFIIGFLILGLLCSEFSKFDVTARKCPWDKKQLLAQGGAWASGDKVLLLKLIRSPEL